MKICEEMSLSFVIFLVISVFLAATNAKPADDVVEHRTIVEDDDDEVTADKDGDYLFYGALKGKVLHHTTNADGIVTDIIISKPSGTRDNSSANDDFQKIQRAASQLVAIQEKAKQKGIFTEDDNKLYASSLYELGVAAQSLAYRQQNGQIQDFSQLLQTGGMSSNQTAIKQEASNEETEQEVQEQHVSEDQAQQQQETILSEESSFIPGDDPYEDVVDSIAVNVPKKDSPVASAKPVALSIAGDSGSAVARPSGVALAGPEGLAISSPKATALAGISPEEVSRYNIFPHYNKLVIKDNQQQFRNSPAATHNANDGSRMFTGRLIHTSVGQQPATYASAYKDRIYYTNPASMRRDFSEKRKERTKLVGRSNENGQVVFYSF